MAVGTAALSADRAVVSSVPGSTVTSIRSGTAPVALRAVRYTPLLPVPVLITAAMRSVARLPSPSQTSTLSPTVCFAQPWLTMMLWSFRSAMLPETRGSAVTWASAAGSTICASSRLSATPSSRV